MTGKRSHHSKSNPRPDPRPGNMDEKRPESYTVRTDSGLEIRPELFDGEARKEAERCKHVSDTQMRRFFGAAKAEQMGALSENQARVAMALLKAKAHYAAARDRKNMELARLLNTMRG